MDPISSLLGPWSAQINAYSILLRLVLAGLIGSIVGCERASKRHSAGLRTFIIISLGSSAAMILEEKLAASHDFYISLIATATILSVATISVRSLYKSSRSQIMGLTTSTALWCCGILGLASGAGYYTLTLILGGLLILSLSALPFLESFLKNRSNHFEIHLELKDSKRLKDFVATIRLLGLKIDNIELNKAYQDSGLSVYTIAISVMSAEMKKFKTHKEIIEALSSLDYIYHIEEMWL